MHVSMRALIASVATLGIALTLPACDVAAQQASGTARPLATPSAPAAAFNQADVTFVQQMIPHHQQAVHMADLAASRATSPQVRQLAGMIKAAQSAEIQTMTGWLRAWGQPTAMPSNPMGGMEHGMPGMMSGQDMSRMAAMHGQPFDRMFLQMMIIHHQGAIEMARTELARGVNPAARRLARSIEVSQSAQIRQMRQLLQGR
jgi:uncharacterized protein (DUF305 family)